MMHEVKMNYRLDGLLVSPAQESDVTYRKYAAAFNMVSAYEAGMTDEVRLEEYTPISQQGNLPFCVANAGCDAIETVLGRNGYPVVQLSRNFSHYNARLEDGTTSELVGTYIRSFFKGVEKFGVCPEPTWPYEERTALLHPSVEAYQEADCNMGVKSYRIDDGIDAEDIENKVMVALHTGLPMIIGIDVGQEFLDYGSSTDITFDPPTVVRGRHAVVITGHDPVKKRTLIRNSWGRSWGQNGYGWISLEYLTRSMDRWVVASSGKVVGRE